MHLGEQPVFVWSGCQVVADLLVGDHGADLGARPDEPVGAADDDAALFDTCNVVIRIERVVAEDPGKAGCALARLKEQGPSVAVDIARDGARIFARLQPLDSRLQGSSLPHSRGREALDERRYVRAPQPHPRR